jgi:hypothetical protein
MKTSYLYLRTKLSLQHQYEHPLEHFAKHVPMDNIETRRDASRNSVFWTAPFEWLHFDQKTWANGLVIRLNVQPTLEAFVEKARPALEPFHSWALIDDNGEHSETPQNGPFSSFMSKAGTRPIVKIFALDDDVGLIAKVFDRMAERLSLTAQRVFHLDDGRVMFMQSDAPVSYVRRKCESELSRLRRHVITDAEGSSEPKDAWVALQRQELAQLAQTICGESLVSSSL